MSTSTYDKDRPYNDLPLLPPRIELETKAVLKKAISVDSPLKERFLLEAGSSLPGLVDGGSGLEEVYTAMLLQRARLKSDQQLVEWPAQ